MSTSAAWCILALHTPPSSSSPLSIFFIHCGSVSFPRPEDPPESPSLVPVVAPKRQLASLPAPPPPPVLSSSLSLSLSLSLFLSLPLSVSLTPRPCWHKKNPPSFLHCLLLSLVLSLAQYSLCLLPKPRQCQPYDITQLPYMGNGGLPWRQQTPPVSLSLPPLSLSHSLSLCPSTFFIRR